MRTLFAVVAVVGLVGFAAGNSKQDDQAKKILGTWEITKAGGDVGPGSTLEFAKDGKLVMMVKMDDKFTKVEGTYKIEKDQLTLTLKVGDQSLDQTVTLKKLTDEDMELEDKDKIDVLKKQKPK